MKVQSQARDCSSEVPSFIMPNEIGQEENYRYDDNKFSLDGAGSESEREGRRHLLNRGTRLRGHKENDCEQREYERPYLNDLLQPR